MIQFDFMIFLVGGFNHLEKYEFVNGKDYPIYFRKLKMFQTTNQFFHHFNDPVMLWINSWSWGYKMLQIAHIIQAMDDDIPHFENPHVFYVGFTRHKPTMTGDG